MLICAIDPGPVSSAYVLLGIDDRITATGHLDNSDLLRQLARDRWGEDVMIVIEQIESMGMAVGAEVFETVFWSGRFAEAAGTFDRVTRRAVKLHLCGSMRAKDANIRQALIDRFGGNSAIGTKKAPGPLYRVKSHAWAALAVAVTYRDQQQRTEASA